MVYSNRESTKKAIRTALDREVKECNTSQTDENSRFNTSVDWNELPKK